MARVIGYSGLRNAPLAGQNEIKIQILKTVKTKEKEEIDN
jgi:hypothetical protein